ncbi:glycosyltransferase family 25 protein [Acinetobacter halotolerans]|uniref:Glycosyltransferase family 25 protein n=1 Tax=Acinetobacter halotolerans TaxID=1752076 RepID=A0A4Q6X919_9GAMM|nr:glycosyltransferase family 25 protein [Acinetobacter halotolerans]RZF50800.1 glycosyltransferase family 25 protein [Acinetobacter halotolerans]
MKVVTYLINLEGSDQRLASATAQLNQESWGFSRFPAYDGRGKALSEFENYDDDAAQQILGRSLISSELGCYLSHYGCAEKFLETDADYLVVLEDDIDVLPNFKQNLDSLLNYLDQHKELDWYVVNIAAKKKKLAKDIVQIQDYSLWHAYYFPIRGVGLVWSRKGAEEFVRLGKMMQVPVDIFFQSWLSKNGKGLGVWQPFVQPAGLDSDILGTVATQGIKRKDLENRSASHGFKKQKRMWRDRFYAIKHLIS